VLTFSLILTLSLTACDNGGGGSKTPPPPKPNTDPKTLVVTDITGLTKPITIILLLDKDKSDAWTNDPDNNPLPFPAITASNIEENSGTISFPLFTVDSTGFFDPSDESTKWKGTGSFYPVIYSSDDWIPFDADDEMFVSYDVIEYSTTASKTIAWNKFVPYP
jgi:hypothetical protein